MKTRIVILCGLLAMLSGCATVKKLWPESLGGSTKMALSDQGLSTLGNESLLQKSVIEAALKQRYTLQEGMVLHRGHSMSRFEATHESGEPLLIFYGEPAGKLKEIVVQDKSIPSIWGVTVGSRFYDVYEKAAGACLKGEEPETILCKAPEGEQVYYLFSGSWSGPQALMPPDELLRDWTVKQILWQSAEK